MPPRTIPQCRMEHRLPICPPETLIALQQLLLPLVTWKNYSGAQFDRHLPPQWIWIRHGAEATVTTTRTPQAKMHPRTRMMTWMMTCSGTTDCARANKCM